MLKLLIADDLEVSRKYLAMFLERFGYQVIDADDGDEALRLTKVERPDLAIVDLLMPKMDGFEYVKGVRNDPDPAVARTPVIFLSSNFPVDDLKAIANALGVRHILEKTAFHGPILKAIREETQRSKSRLQSNSPSTPATVSVPVSEYDFKRQHLELITGKLVAEFNGIASAILDYINTGNEPNNVGVRPSPAIANPSDIPVNP